MGLVFDFLWYSAITLAIAFLAAYFFSTRKFGHWKKKGIKYLKPLPFVGNLKDVALMRKSIGIVAKEIYERHKTEQFIGLYAFDEPILQVHDLDLVKAVFAKDFRYFCDRSLNADEKLDPILARAIFCLNGDRWKQCRTALSPSFTPGKMKRMNKLVLECANLLTLAIEKDAKKGSPIAVYELVARYTTDTIASCAFGIQGHTLENPNAEFRRVLRLIFEFTPKEALTRVAAFLAPKLASFLGLKMIKPEIENFILRTISSTIKERESHQIKRNDLLDSLLELKNSGRIADEDGHTIQQTHVNHSFDLLDVAGNSLAFLMAGFETSATTISYILYELAMHSDVQDKLRQEIQDVISNGILSFVSVHGMKYLDMIIQETLRKYPPLPFIDRVSNEPYTLPGTTVTLETGTRIMVPSYGFHMDPEYFPNPKHFDPERFSEQNKKHIVHYSLLPFGEGPRSCVGTRFAIMQMKTALTSIISKYSVQPCSSTPKDIVFNPNTFLLQPKGSIELIFRTI